MMLVATELFTEWVWFRLLKGNQKPNFQNLPKASEGQFSCGSRFVPLPSGW